MSARRILGIDPGLRTTGYGIIACDRSGLRLIEGGVVQPDPTLPLERRLAQLHEAMLEIVHATQPECMVVEELWTSYKNPTTAVLMAHARGVIALAAGTTGIAMHQLGHSLVKRALAGSGAARKAQVGEMVVRILGLQAVPQPADVSDALAIAITFANVDAQRTRFAEVGVALPSARTRATRLA